MVESEGAAWLRARERWGYQQRLTLSFIQTLPPPPLSPPPSRQAHYVPARKYFRRWYGAYYEILRQRAAVKIATSLPGYCRQAAARRFVKVSFSSACSFLTPLLLLAPYYTHHHSLQHPLTHPPSLPLSAPLSYDDSCRTVVSVWRTKCTRCGRSAGSTSCR